MQSVTKRANAYKMSDNEGEIEDVSFLGAQTDKRSVYEPKDFQRCRQLVCSQTRAIVIVVILCLLALTIALIAAFATPSLKSCGLEEPTKVKPEKPQQFIATNGDKFPWTNIRLPDHVAPLVYRLFMHPNLTTFHFRGTVEIDFVVNEQTDFLIFHSKKLNISSHDLTKEGSKDKTDIVKSLEYLEFEQMYLKLGSSLRKGGVYTLKMAFVGLLSDSLAGFYKSSYETSAREKRWLATTHFEPTDARAAFPCFDEPQLKANFSLSMVRDEQHISLFNTQKLQEETSSESPHLKIDHFAISVKMSTYLVAFVVCDYGHLSAYTANGTKVSVYAPEEHLHQAKFACDSAASILGQYEEFFGEKYPLQKQDLIAIPDFAAGAMENWGLITYRFTAILFDKEESSASNQQWVAVVVAHELAHQWFGNLVTMKWWDDLWLNEGFASFVEYIGAGYVAPKWHMMDQFIADTLVQALHQDSLSNSHPISVPVHNPAQINEIFDAISYDKGASIIRMLDGFLTRDVLQDGLKTYLTRHKYGNAETDDLWQALSDEAKKHDVNVDVKRVMDTWTKQMGFPLITAHRDGDVITVMQKRFLLNPRGNQSKEFESPFGYKWNIPVTYSTSEDRHTFMKWFEKDKDSFALKHQPTWYKLNVDQVGFYRVHYSDDNWQLIIKQLNNDHTVFSPADRAGLLDDVFSLARSGELDATVALQLSQYLKKETEYVPWSVGLDGLQYIGHLLEDKPSYTYFSEFLLDLLEVQLNQTTWKDDGEHLEKFLRALVLGEAILLYHKPSVEQGKQLYKKWMTNGEKVPANLKNMVYHAGVRYGGPEEWNFAWDQYTKTDVPSEKKKLLYALSRTTDGLQLDRYLRMAVDDTKVRKADTVLVVSYIALNPAGRVLAWRFVKQNWDLFYNRYGVGGFEMTRLVTKVTKSFTTQYDHDEVAEFFANHLAGSGKRAVSQTLESIQMNIDWLKRNEKPVVDWLQAWAKSKSNQ